MSTMPAAPLLRQIRHLIGAGHQTGLTDGQLLHRFVVSRDEAAFEGLVRRYGPLVLGVCRRVLCDAHAAEDAFQATFLVLVRKASSLDDRQPLGCWLSTVAHRLSLRARATAGKRRQKEEQAASARTEIQATPHGADLNVALEEELMRLPEKHRAPLVLCYLEGKTNEQAAQALGCPKGSMSWRLAQARDVLRDRLHKRGYVTMASTLGALLTTTAAQSAVPTALMRTTVGASLWFATRESGMGVASAHAVELAQGVLRTMIPIKASLAAGLLVVAGLLGGAAVLSEAGAQTPEAATTSARLTPPSEAPSNGGPSTRLGSSALRHGDAVFYAAYSPDGRTLLTASKDQTLRLWDLASGREVRRFDRGNEQLGGMPMMAIKGAPRMAALSFNSFQAALSPDGKWVAGTRGNQIRLWETSSGKKLQEWKLPTPSITTLTFAKDSKSLGVVHGNRHVTIWDVNTGKEMRRYPAQDPAQPEAIVLTSGSVAALSADLTYAALQSIDVGTQTFSVKVIEVATGKEMPEIKAPVGGAQALAFAPDGKALVLGSTVGGVQFVDFRDGKELQTLGELQGRRPTSSLALSPDGKTLLQGREGSILEIWDVASNKVKHQIGEGPPASGKMVVVRVMGMGPPAGPAMAFSPDGKTIAASLGGTGIRQFDLQSGKEMGAFADGHSSAITSLGLSANGQTLLTHGRGDPLRSWDLATGKANPNVTLPPNTTLVSLSADGTHLVAIRQGNAAVISTKDNKEISKVDLGADGVTSATLSTDGKILATRDAMSADIRLWDTTTGKEHRVISPAVEARAGGGVIVLQSTGLVSTDVIFSPDGRFLAGAGGKRQLCLWDVTTGEQVWESSIPQNTTAERLAFSPDGRTLALRNTDGTVTLFETATGERRGLLGKAEGGAAGGPGLFTVAFGGMAMPLGDSVPPSAALAFSPDGRSLASAEASKPAVRIWDILSGEEMGRLEGHEGTIVSVLFTPDGKRLITGSRDTTAAIWDLNGRLKASTPAKDSLDAAALESLWADLAGREGEKAFAAIRTLSRHPKEAVAFLAGRLQPAEAQEASRLGKLIADLDSEEFETRRKAEAELERLGDLATAELRKALEKSPSLELKQRAERLLRKLSGSSLEGQPLRELRAVEALGAMGTESRSLLERLAKGAPGARLTSGAKAALERSRK